MNGAVRRLAAVPAVLGVLALACACKAPFSSSPAPAPPPSTPAPAATLPRAALAGGACLLMDFDTTNAALGTSFAVSAAADTSGTYTCLLRGTAAAQPSLIISVTATTLVATDFSSDVVPPGAANVSGLGLIGYSMTKVVSGSEVDEVGWLSGNDRLIIMDYTFAAGATAQQAAALLPKLVGLARTVDSITV